MSVAELRRIDPWLSLIGDLVREPLTTYPYDAVLMQFGESFDARPSWNWREPDGSWGFEGLAPTDGWPQPDDVDFWDREGFQRHPLMKWMLATGSPWAQSLGRVPYGIASRQDHELVHSSLRGIGLDEQLSIPYRLSDGSLRSFVIARTGEDFTDADISFAQRLQPLLELLDRQVRVLAARRYDQAAVLHSGLTGRELAVLRLLADGHTSSAIGHRLGASPRTVQKHLQHIYRKLEVGDRLMAVRVAAARGLLSDTPTTFTLPVTTVRVMRRGTPGSWAPPLGERVIA